MNLVGEFIGTVYKVLESFRDKPNDPALVERAIAAAVAPLCEKDKDLSSIKVGVVGDRSGGLRLMLSVDGEAPSKPWAKFYGAWLQHLTHTVANVTGVAAGYSAKLALLQRHGIIIRGQYGQADSVMNVSKDEGITTITVAIKGETKTWRFDDQGNYLPE